MKPWSVTAEQVLQTEQSDPRTGLSSTEAPQRLKEFGPNRLVKERTTTFWGVFREEVTEPMILLLLVVGVLYAIWGEMRDVITIFVVIVVLVSTEVFTEYRAKKSITALRRLSPPNTSVLRGGVYTPVPAADVVRGDIILLEVGDSVPADGRVIDSFGLQTDESLLTGESTPVVKENSVLSESEPLADRSNMVFAGTTVCGGRGRAVVTATGMDTELGKITGLVLEAKEPRTPLQTAMRQLAGFLVWVAVFFSVVIPLVGIIEGKPYQEMILTGLSLSFATIPEELPIIITMVLGLGALALSRKHVLIRRLRAAETLGGVTVIVADKTGTITENKMCLAELASDNVSSTFPKGNLSPADSTLLRVGVLTSHLKKTAEDHYAGDPLEVALLEAAESADVDPEKLQAQYTLKEEFSFDNRRKMMSVVLEQGGEALVYAKGAPEIILAKSSRIARESGEKEMTKGDEEIVLKRAESMADEAMRVIAFAYKKVVKARKLARDEAETDLVFLGLAGLADPPRAGVAEAIRATKEAGIRTIIVSGDHPLTVQKIAAEVGIDHTGKLMTGIELGRMDEKELKEKIKEVSVFARINPDQKLRIVQALHAQGEVVAVTGDGINDAPALKSADIGVAMGEKGTEAAREAASMVLTDDSYTSIVDGVREGRKIFDNLRKGVMYYLSVKIALVLTFLVPLVLGLPFPFAPIQIVLLELFMDLGASATFVAEPIEPDIMHRPPRSPQQKFIDREMLTNMCLGAVSLAAAVLINYLVTWHSGWGLLEARSVAFGTWLIGHVFVAFTMRSPKEPLLKIGVMTNKVMLAWAVAAFLFLLLVTSLPVTGAALKVTSLNLTGWLLVIGVPLVAIFWLELKKLVVRT